MKTFVNSSEVEMSEVEMGEVEEIKKYKPNKSDCQFERSREPIKKNENSKVLICLHPKMFR